MALGYKGPRPGYKGPRPKKPTPFPLSTMVVPICSSRRTIRKLKRLKYLTDNLVCWMHKQGYSEFSLEIYGSAMGSPGQYRVSLKLDH